jgi:hypothetical protein
MWLFEMRDIGIFMKGRKKLNGTERVNIITRLSFLLELFV